MLKVLKDKFLIETVVFTSGALVMVYEIIGSRILAPFIGTSTYVWTSLIGVILGSLSLGYWLGGRFADEKAELRMLSVVLFAAGSLLSLTLLLQTIVLAGISSMAMGLEIKSVIAALILFAPASVLFGFITPYAVRLKMADVENSGKTVGRLYALSTIGSILGTFLAGFFLLPFVGSIRTMYLLAGICFVLAVLLLPFSLSKNKVFFLFIFPLAIALNEAQAYYLFKLHEFQDIDTQYNRLQIFRDTDQKTGNPIRVIISDPFTQQSASFLDNDDLVLSYQKFYNLLPYYKPNFNHVLFIGGAAYSVPRKYLQTYPGIKVDVVEIDPQMTEIARHHFRLPENNPNLHIFHEDGRVFLNQVESKKYDAILIDAFNSVYSVPYQLTTREAVQKMRQGLKVDGIVILNLISAGEGVGSQFLQAEIKTYQEFFPQIYVFKVKDEKPAQITQNFVLVAAKTDFTGQQTEEINQLLKNRYEFSLQLNTPVLTDDLAPVEYYNSLAQKTAK
jgi:spermidine synthase